MHENRCYVELKRGAAGTFSLPRPAQAPAGTFSANCGFHVRAASLDVCRRR